MAAVALAAALAVPGIEPAHADSASEYVIVIKDHRFQPSELTVPAGQRVKLVIDNRDPTPEEFESLDLRREKIVPGGSKATLWVGPLRPGEYGFVGEFNQASAKGKLIAK
ncbi:MAG: cupredoxin domain-containing protein [Proteobacteria bacterium]|nr:cupredoxin domain-containing protein [Pseudomonadota bacterium]